MKSLFIALLAILTAIPAGNETFTPYTIGLESTEGVDVLRPKVEAQLKANGFTVIGRTTPANEKSRRVITITSPDLDKAVQTAQGSSGFASVLRVALTREGSKTIVSYTTPEYWGYAYFQKKYSSVSTQIAQVHSSLKAAFTALGTYSGEGFGSKKGLKASKLKKYQYMMGMPSFNDPVVLKKFGSHKEAVAHIDANIAAGIPNVTKVYKHKVPGHNVTLYGFALAGKKGESHFLPIIDINSPKHTAFLPYEVLVKNGEVHMLHGRYRIALSFPDLTMGTFMKIMSTPGDIEELLKQVVE